MMTTVPPVVRRASLIISTDDEYQAEIELAALRVRCGQQTVEEIVAKRFGDNIVILKPRSKE